MKRRTFIKSASLAGAATVIGAKAFSEGGKVLAGAVPARQGGPVVLSTWDFGQEVPQAAVEALAKGGTLIDAVERAVMIPEADPKVTSVGYGGYPHI